MIIFKVAFTRAKSVANLPSTRAHVNQSGHLKQKSQTNDDRRYCLDKQQAKSNNPFSSAAKALLSNSLNIVQREQEHSRTVNQTATLSEELERLFKHEEEPKPNPHRRLFPLTASAVDNKKIWVGQQNYKAMTRTVHVNPSFRSKYPTSPTNRPVS